MGRKSKKLSARPAIGIYCEGESEVQYFTMLSQKYNKKNVRSQKLTIKPLKKSGKKLIEAANLQKQANKQVKAYVIFDRDTEYIDKEHIRKLKECEKLAKKYNITILFSSINFEIWILMHYESVMRSYTKRELYEKLSGKNYFNRDYKKFKGSSYHPYLFDKVNNAIVNAANLYKRHDEIEKDDPYKNIHLYLKEIFNIDVF